MSTPAVTEDTVDAPRAAPRLWSPDLPSPPDPAAPIQPAPRRRKASAKAPAPSAPTPPGPPAAVSRYSPTIKELPEGERPRERLYASGPQALSTAELLAILIRVGNQERSAVSLGEHLLAHFGNMNCKVSAPMASAIPAPSRKNTSAPSF